MPDQAVILLAEDREDDVLLIKHAFAKANIPNPLYIVRDGEEAIAYLKGEGKFANRDEYPLPELLLLDLKMPKMTGFDVIQWVREQPTLSALRILVLTSSEELQDVNNAYSLGANSFLVKPHDFEDFMGLSRIIRDYWLRTAKAPQISRSPRENGRTKSG
jgi:CheY-like chemotaxis protein